MNCKRPTLFIAAIAALLLCVWGCESYNEQGGDSRWGEWRTVQDWVPYHSDREPAQQVATWNEPASETPRTVATAAPAPAPTPTPVATATPAAATIAPAAPASLNGWTRGQLAYPTGEPGTSALLLQKSMPAEVMVGKPFDYELKVTNISKLKLDDVEVAEAMPANFKIGPDAGATVKDNVARYHVGNLNPGESKTFKVSGTAANAGPLNTCASVSYNTGLCMATSVVAPALRLALAAPPEIMACDVIPVKLTVSNNGTGSARNIMVEQPLPPGMTTEDGRNTISFDVGSLAAGQSKDITFNAKVAKTGKYESKATAKAEGGLSAESNQAVTLAKQPVLEIAKTGPSKQFVGRPVTYDITVANKGDGIAANTILNDAIPAGAKFEAASDNGRPSAGAVQWNLGDLPPGASKKVSVTMSGANTGMLKSQATAQAKCAAAASAAAQTEFSGIPALLLECVDVSDPIEVGQDQTYIVTVTNQGSANDSNIKIVCNLEDTMQFGSAGGATRGASAGKTITFEPLPSLAPKAKAEWKIVVKAVNPGDTRFKIDMTSDQLTRPVTETESSNFYK